MNDDAGRVGKYPLHGNFVNIFVSIDSQIFILKQQIKLVSSNSRKYLLCYRFDHNGGGKILIQNKNRIHLNKQWKNSG